MVVKANSDDSSPDQKEESEEEEDSSSEDDLGECVVLEEGKYKLSANFVAKMEREKIEKAQRKAAKHEAKLKKE